jgi:hypothetical protein
MNTAVQNTEELRISEQARLDAMKTAAERNKWGQFATPPDLAQSIARHMHAFIGDGQGLRFLDPALGTGSFFSALAHTTPPGHIETATGIELDPLFADTAAQLWSSEGLAVIKGDFTRQRPPEHGYNFVLTNPPYVRHHHLPAKEKDRLKHQLARSLHLEISGLAGLYCYFLLLSHDWMEDGGVAAWLIPSEFMDVNYGITLRRYLTERVTLLHIHRFCPSDVQFTDALVSSAVVIFRKKAPSLSHAARFSFGGPLDRPQSEALVSLDVLKRSRKWTQFPARSEVSSSDEPKLGALFSIKRGIATGSNEFFILTEDAVKQHHIPPACVKPILPGPRHLAADIVEALPNGSPDVTPRLFLLDCKEPEERIKGRWPQFHAYLQQGKEQKSDTSYLASHRAPWYSQEDRPPAPFLCTYMGRSRNGKHPFRFIWNRSQATAHNVYLMLYPKGPLKDTLTQHPELAEQVFEALQRITPAQLLSEGRVYGGGLHKVEPRELAQIPAGPILEALQGRTRIAHQEKLFS